MTAHDDNVNSEIADHLTAIGRFYVLTRDEYRSKAFLTAANTIRTAANRVNSGAEALRLPGVGKSSAEVIDEFLTTGTSARYRELEAKLGDQIRIINNFKSYHGIGIVSAIKFYENGRRSIEDVWFNEPLTAAQKVGILWSKHIDLKIPRREMDIIAKVLGDYLNPYGIVWNITGSYRRGEETSGDIDLLIRGQPNLNLSGIIQLLRPILPADLAQGETKYMGILRLSDQYDGHRIDIHVAPADHYASTLMYFTGSKEFNVLMRNRALSMGYSLSEYGLKPMQIGLPVPIINTEEDIFRALNVPYLTPVQRLRGMTVLPQ